MLRSKGTIFRLGSVRVLLLELYVRLSFGDVRLEFDKVGCRGRFG